MNGLHLLNNPLSVILPSAFFPFGVYLMYIFFSTSLPRDLLAAARVDGCSEWGVFRRVAVPLARPMVGLVAFFVFVSQWNNFFLVEVMLSSASRLTLQVGLVYISNTAFVPFPGLPLSQQILRPELAMAGIILAFPVVVFFAFIQRNLLRGLLAGYAVG
jgi:multiple sugar transport system permease protein